MLQPDSEKDPGARARFFIAVCPSCSTRLRVPRDIANKKTPCPECAALWIPADLPQASDVDTTGESVAHVRCPECGTVAEFQATICVACGLDFRTGKKLRRPPSTAEKLQRVNQRIKNVKADLRKETKLLFVQGVLVLSVFLVVTLVLSAAMPFLGSWGALCAAIGLFSLARPC
ncbi:MAG: hypothetical protein MUF48_18640 [Pirellulaceae bacterium]|jgi:RNase P subunit RPR2|nr:hypothetical protein [Pirellulaceae bacterium]